MAKTKVTSDVLASSITIQNLTTVNQTVVGDITNAPAWAGTDVLLVGPVTGPTANAGVEILAGANTGTSYLHFADPDARDAGGLQYVHSTNTMSVRVNASNVITIAGATMTNNAESVRSPFIPAFLAYLNTTITNVTGAGTNYTVIFDTEVYDQSGDFNLGTGAFIAPVQGRYLFSCSVRMAGVEAAMTQRIIQLITSNRSYGYLDLFAFGAAANCTQVLSVLADMDAGDSAIVRVTYSNGAGDTADVVGAATPYTYFSGAMLV